MTLTTSPLSPVDTAVPALLREQGYALLDPGALQHELSLSLPELDAWRDTWERLPRDPYLRDGGHYRARRHACFVQNVGQAIDLTLSPRRAHWQPTSYNALHGGIERWFEPIEPAVSGSAAWARLLCGLGKLFAQRTDTPRWYIEAHQFRIDTAEGIGRPTPEGVGEESNGTVVRVFD